MASFSLWAAPTTLATFRVSLDANPTQAYASYSDNDADYTCNKVGSNSSSNYCKVGNQYYMKLTGGDAFVKIKLKTGNFKVDDVVYVYHNHTSNKNGVGFAMTEGGTNGATGNATANVELELSYTLTASDIANDGSISIFRQGSNLYLGRIVVQRANTDGPFTVTYDKNHEGASGSMTDANSPYAKNSTVTVLGNSFIAPTGMIFAGWNTKADGSGTSYAAGNTFDAVKDVTLFAQWTYPATGTGTITYTLTKGSDAVSAAVSGVATLSSSSTAFSASTLEIGSSNSKDGYSGQITGHAEAYSASQYVALQFTVADGYTFTPSAVSMKVFANSTSNMKMKLVLTDGVTSVESQELSCASSADSDIEFASGAFTGKIFMGNVNVILYQWGVTSKRTYVKSPVSITGTVAEMVAPTITSPTSDPEVAEYTIGDAITALSVTATGNPTPTYQWYKNSSKTATIDNEHKIADATNASYTPSNEEASDFYYYCVASNTKGSATSPFFHVTVSAAPTFDATYVSDKGSAPSKEAAVSNITLPTISPVTGFIHTAWTADQAVKVSGAIVAANTEIEVGTEVYLTQNTTFTAVWTPVYSVTYVLNGPSGDAPTQAPVTAGTEISLAAAPSWAGYEFTGWLCNIDDKVKAAGSAYTMTAANTTFTAQWSQLFAITKATVTNGSITVSAENAIAGTTVTLTATPAFRYLFGAWDVYKTGDESTKVTVTNNKFTMPEYAVTVSATFVADTRKQILYLKSSTSTSNDKMYSALNSVEDYNVIVEVPASQTVTNYDLIVLHESLSGNLAKSDGNAMIRGLKTADVPVLNTKSYFYNSDRWDWGTPNAGTSVTGATLNSAYCNTASHPIFEGVTISEGFVTLFSEEKAKAMQPVEPKSGKEGFTLATTSNDGKGTGTTCIQELTPAQRGIEGVSTSKYLLISIGNENGCFDLLTADGQKLIKNAAAYLLSDETWTPKTLEVTIAGDIEHGSVEVDIDCAAEGDEITLSNEPADGYQFVAYDVYNTSDAETKVIVTDGKFTMPAYAVTVSATFAELFAITCSPAENGSVTADKAKAIAGETVTLTVNPDPEYVATNVSYNGTTINPVENVYSFIMPAANVTVTATFAKSASGVDNTEVGAKAVKTLKNGLLIIEKNGVRYNMLGERVQ